MHPGKKLTKNEGKTVLKTQRVLLSLCQTDKDLDMK